MRSHSQLLCSYLRLFLGMIPFELLVVWVHGLAVAVETTHGVRVVAAGYLKGTNENCSCA